MRNVTRYIKKSNVVTQSSNTAYCTFREASMKVTSHVVKADAASNYTLVYDT